MEISFKSATLWKRKVQWCPCWKLTPGMLLLLFTIFRYPGGKSVLAEEGLKKLPPLPSCLKHGFYNTGMHWSHQMGVSLISPLFFHRCRMWIEGKAHVYFWGYRSRKERKKMKGEKKDKMLSEY